MERAMDDGMYRTLFEQVPCYVTVLDRDYRIRQSNACFRDKFGKHDGEKCYEVFKRRGDLCESCPARETFEDGQTHSAEQVGMSQDGETTHYIVTTAPATRGPDAVTRVIEMAVDVTELRAVETKLRRANVLREALVEHSADAILGTGPLGHLLVFNPAAEKLFGIDAATVLGRPLEKGMVPVAFESVVDARRGDVFLKSATIGASSGEEVPVHFSGHALKKGGEFLGTAAFIQDLRRVRQLEKEKIDAERLAAVGQTVAGLAHGIKNILTGLEGGMYFLQSGLKGGMKERLDEGWDMLERNMERISVLVRNLLSFSKGRVPQVAVVAPGDLVDEMVGLFREAASLEGIDIVPEVAPEVAPAALDAEGIHSCLANLVGNAIDACQSTDRRPCSVHIRTHDEGGALVFEVEDEGCGMDQKVRDLAFTNFFTTKGSGGTGLGLLITRKIAQEHGGRVEFESTPEKGSIFRLIFPRDRLPEPGLPAGARG
jgi:PAS domain S-box-containing protein